VASLAGRLRRPNHLRKAGIQLQAAAYRGGGQAINDLIAGHVKLGSLGSTPLLPHYKADTLLLLAQTTEARSQSLPDVPTYQEAGVQGLVLDQWLGAFVPAGTPAAITTRLNSDIGKALADPAIRANLVGSAQDQSVAPPKHFPASWETSSRSMIGSCRAASG
jgi:tripartite-type tricarboxylate transporter receptor subunit TctC